MLVYFYSFHCAIFDMGLSPGSGNWYIFLFILSLYILGCWHAGNKTFLHIVGSVLQLLFASPSPNVYLTFVSVMLIQVCCFPNVICNCQSICCCCCCGAHTHAANHHSNHSLLFILAFSLQIHTANVHYCRTRHLTVHLLLLIRCLIYYGQGLLLFCMAFFCSQSHFSISEREI